MKSKDLQNSIREEFAKKLSEAIQSGEPDQVAQAMADMTENIQTEILERAKDVASDRKSVV